jgi:hypothetical protein
MSQDQVIKLAIHRIQDGLALLADACKMEDGSSNEVSCFFKISEERVMHFDNIVMRKTEKLCRRKSPRLEVNGLTIDTREKK